MNICHVYFNFCNAFIKLELSPWHWRRPMAVFVMAMTDCANIFMKPGGEKIECCRVQG